ncbi:hypothetical protein RI367_003893 [Sorochytrium milnesiophthora]
MLYAFPPTQLQPNVAVAILKQRVDGAVFRKCQLRQRREERRRRRVDRARRALELEQQQQQQLPTRETDDAQYARTLDAIDKQLASLRSLLQTLDSEKSQLVSQQPRLQLQPPPSIPATTNHVEMTLQTTYDHYPPYYPPYTHQHPAVPSPQPPSSSAEYVYPGYRYTAANYQHQPSYVPHPPLPPPRNNDKFSNGRAPGAAGFWREVAIIFTVFGVTGSSSMVINRRVVNSTVGEGSWRDGPMAWRAAYVTCGLPIYSLTLLTLGTLSGRGAYFRNMLVRMWGRFLPRSVRDQKRG